MGLSYPKNETAEHREERLAKQRKRNRARYGRMTRKDKDERNAYIRAVYASMTEEEKEQIRERRRVSDRRYRLRKKHEQNKH